MPIGPSKGSIDLLSNSLYLSEGPTAELVRHAMEGKLPDSMFAVFLHEATHHWCLSGQVGRALACMGVEAQRRWTESPLGVDPLIALKWARLTAAQHVLEPLLEGMAQFAEFDVFPGASAALSPVMGWASALFSHHIDAEQAAALDPIQRAKYLLSAYRCTDLANRRKSSVLVKPLSNQEGGYLLGYLAIKNTWLSAARRSQRLRDSDLFLTYLRNLLLHDPGLVEVLLRPTYDEIDDTNRMIERIDARLKLLDAADLDERVARFEQAIAAKQSVDDAWESLYVAQDYAERIRNELNELQNSCVLGAAGTERKRSSDAFVDAAAFLHRPLVRLSADEVTLLIGADHRCEVSRAGAALFSIVVDATIPPGESKGMLALYFLPDHLAPLLICMREQVEIFTLCPKSVPKEALIVAKLAICQVLRSEQTRATITEVLASDEALAARMDIGAAIDAGIDNLYLNFALCFVAQQHVEACLDRMRENGFWAILGEDGDRITQLAALSLICACTSRSDLVSALLLQFHATELPALLDTLRIAHRDFGYAFIPPETGKSYCFV